MEAGMIRSLSAKKKEKNSIGRHLVVATQAMGAPSLLLGGTPSIWEIMEAEAWNFRFSLLLLPFYMPLKVTH